ncbi:MAG: phosphohistidine phosphatase SixA [Succinatimonas sp.]|nr:phosphohistidine phosphatase SixA [Succinatimonas sp.]
MRIVILRHGEATLSNCDRVLSSQGMKEAVATGQKLSKILTITKCFCSPKTRTEQTANIVCQQLGFDGNKETLSELTPSGNPAKIISYIDETCDDEDTVLLVSHLPLVELLAYEYNCKLNFPPRFSTACALIIDYDYVRGKYKRFISPAHDDVIFD